MANNGSLSEREKREGEQLQKEIQAMAELLLDIYEEKLRKEKEGGSNPAGSQKLN